MSIAFSFLDNRSARRLEGGPENNDVDLNRRSLGNKKINKNEITSAQCIAMMVLTIILKGDANGFAMHHVDDHCNQG